MMYQKIIVPIDHGNRNMKTEHKIFTSGFVEGDCRPRWGSTCIMTGATMPLRSRGYLICGTRLWMTVSSS